MLQTAERQLVPTLLTAHLVCSAVDVAMSVLGVVLGFQSDLFTRVSCMAGDRARNAVLVVVLGNWVILLCSFLVVQSVFNMFSGVEAEETWRKRFACLGGLLRGLGVAGLVGSDTDPMSDAARTFTRMFSHIDFVASDFATALVLVGISHAEEARRREAAEWEALRKGDPAGSGGSAPPLPPLAENSVLANPGGPGAPSFAGGDEAASEAGDGGSDIASRPSSAASGDLRLFGFAAPSPVPGAHTPLLGARSGAASPFTSLLLAQSRPGGALHAAASAGGEASSSQQSPAPPLLRPGSLAQRALARGRDPVLDAAVSEATHYAAFALAPYGWPLYLWAHPRCGVCDLCCGCGVRGRRRRACWRRTTPFGGPHGPQDAADIAALVRFADLEEDDILHVSFHNSVLGALPYVVARDGRTRSIVLAVRGTLSVADCITDLLYEPAGLDGTLLGGGADGIPPASVAHSGVLGCARALHADLLRHRALHEALASSPPGWRLVVTGHSLGAGVATLLGLMLRPTCPDLRVWAFAPPGGLLSEGVAEAVASWCTSVVLGNDIICRLSMPNLERLRDEMMGCASRAKLPKAAILRRAALAGPQLRASEVMYPPNSYGGLGLEVEAALARYRDGVSAARGGGAAAPSAPGSPADGGGAYAALRESPPAAEAAAAPPAQLYPPGRLLHLVRMGRPSGRGSATVYLPRWTTREQLMSRIVVARNVFTSAPRQLCKGGTQF